MCQFNQYLISSDILSDKVIETMRDAGMGDYLCAGRADEYGYPNYNVYAMSGTGCNCGNIISFLQDKPYKSFDEYNLSVIKEETNKLKEIKDFMLSPDYAKNKAVFIEKRTELSDRKKELFMSLEEFEITPRPHELGQKLSDERNQELQQARQKYDEMNNKISQTKEAKLCLEEINNFIKKIK